MKTNLNQARTSLEEFTAGKDDIFRSIFKEAPIFVVAINSDGRLLMINQYMVESLGYSSSKELIGKDYICELIPAASREEVKEVFGSLIETGKTTRSVNAVIGKQGRKFMVEWHGRPIFNKDSSLDFFIGLGIDISEKEIVMEKLLHQNMLLESLFKNSTDAIARFDKDKRIISINDNFCRLFGYSLSEIEGMDIDAVMDRGKLDSTDRNFTKTVEKGGNIVAEGTRYTSAGLPVELLIKGIPIYMNNKFYGGYAIYSDITDRKKTEQALLASEYRYRDILATIKDGYFEVDLKGNITFSNNATAENLGYQPEELIGVNYKVFCKNPDDVYNAFNKLFRAGEIEHTITTEIVRKDGSTAYGEYTLSVILDNDGRVSGFRGLGRDVTERKHYEEQLKYLSLHDQLTSLYNRSYFEDEMNRLGRSREYPITIIVADLDSLKIINDTLGHEKGDQLLISCARLLKQSLRSSDILARIGGDEFVFILPQTDNQTGKEIVARIEASIEKHNNDFEEGIYLSLSMGFATSSQKSKLLQDTYQEADDLMYRNKLKKGAAAREKILRSVVHTLRKKDLFDSGHAVNLQKLTAAVGAHTGLAEKQMANLFLLSEVHDLGKVGIPDAILFKNSSLTAEEYAIIRQHSEKGYRIALSSTQLSPVADLILKHHEQYAGGGYPLGIAGEEIPVECRIMAIADAYDVMTNDRPYRKALCKEKAIRELQLQAGTYFDPELLTIFTKILAGEKETI